MGGVGAVASATAPAKISYQQEKAFNVTKNHLAKWAMQPFSQMQNAFFAENAYFLSSDRYASSPILVAEGKFSV